MNLSKLYSRISFNYKDQINQLISVLRFKPNDIEARNKLKDLCEEYGLDELREWVDLHLLHPSKSPKDLNIHDEDFANKINSFTSKAMPLSDKSKNKVDPKNIRTLAPKINIKSRRYQGRPESSMIRQIGYYVRPILENMTFSIKRKYPELFNDLADNLVVTPHHEDDNYNDEPQTFSSSEIEQEIVGQFLLPVVNHVITHLYGGEDVLGSEDEEFDQISREFEFKPKKIDWYSLRDLTFKAFKSRLNGLIDMLNFNYGTRSKYPYPFGR